MISVFAQRISLMSLLWTTTDSDHLVLVGGGGGGGVF